MNRQQRRQIRRQEQGAEPDGDDPIDASGDPIVEVELPELADDESLRESDVPPRRAAVSTAAPRQHAGPRQFLHEVNVEMRKVAWPTRAETLNYSTVVFVTLAVLMALIFVLDLAFNHVAGFLFNP